MNAISKKLLSMLLVTAMVLSMVPFGGLSVFAAETDATPASTTVTPGQANLPDGITTTNPVDNSDEAIQAHITAGTCPMCGATGITWTKKTGIISAGTSHNYFALKTGETESTYSLSTNGISLDGDDTICVAILSGVTLKNTRLRFVMMSGSGNTLRIMGTGNIIADQVSNAQNDVGAMQLGGGTSSKPNVVNLYGGNYTHVTDQADTTEDDQAIIRMKGAYVTVNMWDGAVIGPDSADATQWSENVRISAGTFNMYGGTIQNGASRQNGVSGNVTVAGSGKFNMYGGTIKGGTYYNTTDNTGGNVVVGGLAEKGSDTTAGTFKMYGGTIEGGTANDSGGNISVNHASAVMELWGGTVKDGNAAETGGNIQIMNGTSHVIKGTALITNGSAASGGNIQIASGKKLTMEGGFIQGGTRATSSQNATNGGAVSVAGAFEMTGGEISGCKSSGDGGGIYAVGSSSAAAATVNVSGTAKLDSNISGGSGGNIHLGAYATLNMSGGTLYNGQATTHGGNISGATGATINVSGGEVYEGKATARGGNIRAWNAPVTISGTAYIHDGVSNGNANNGNIWVNGDSATVTYGLTVNGGEIEGDIMVDNSNGMTDANGNTVSVKLSGQPKITAGNKVGLVLATGKYIDASGMTGGSVVVTEALGTVLSTPLADATTAAAIAQYFSCTDSTLVVSAANDFTLVVTEAPEEEPSLDKFEPEKFDGLAYCPVCYEKGTHTEPVEWTVYNGENNSDSNPLRGTVHLYLNEDKTYSTTRFLLGYGNVCINLNGYDVTAVVTDEATPGATFAMGSSGTLNLMDTKTGEADGSVVAGYGTSDSTGAAIHANGANAGNTINVYGGTYTKIASDTVSPIAALGSNGGKLNINTGAVIDGTGLTGTASVYLTGGSAKKAVCTMNGGEIKGLTTSGNGAAVRLGNGSAGKTAEFYLKGGTVTAGTASGDGGAIYGSMCAVNISGGTVQNSTNGSAKNGGLIGMAGSGAVLTISGGNITGGHSTSHGATILLATNTVLNMSGGTVTGGLADGQGGTIRAYRATLNLSGSAKIYAGATSNASTLSKCIWLIRSTLTMTGDSAVYGVGTNLGNAICAAEDGGYGSTVTLSGNATVKHATGSSQRDLYIPYTADNLHKLQITQDWDGVAYFATFKDANTTAYGRGEAVSTTLAEVGTITDGVFTAGGTFSGDLYYSPQNNRLMMGRDGVVYVALALITNSQGTTCYTDYADALTAYYANNGFENGDYLMLGSENAELVLEGDVYVDSVGWAANVSGTGTLYALDSANDDYDGYSTWTVSGDVKVAEDVTNPVNGNRYIVIKNKAGENKYSAHRIEVKLTAVTLRASEAGLYYKASYKCDKTLAGRVSSYGVAVSTKTTPGADFLEDYTNKIGFSCLENFSDVHETTGDNAYTVNATSGSVFGIFKDENLRPDTVDSNGNTVTTAQLNAEYGKMKIYANTYFLVDTMADEDADNDYVVVSDTKNGGTLNGTAFSLWDALVAVDGMWDKLEEKKQTMVKDFYKQWKDLGMSEWANDFTNIDA